MIQILPDDLTQNEAALRHAGRTSVVFVEEHSLRMLAGHLAKIWRKYPVTLCGKMYGPISCSPMTPHHTFTAKKCC
jgi:hypothetical protein